MGRPDQMISYNSLSAAIRLYMIRLLHSTLFFVHRNYLEELQYVYILLTVRSPILLHYEYLMFELYIVNFCLQCIVGQNQKNSHRLKSMLFNKWRSPEGACRVKTFFQKNVSFCLWSNHATTHIVYINYCTIFLIFSALCHE